MAKIDNLGQEEEKKEEYGQKPHLAELKQTLENDPQIDTWNTLHQKSLDLFGPSNEVKQTQRGQFKKLFITANHLEPKIKHPIECTIGLNGSISIHFSPYDHFEEFYFMKEDISLEESTKIMEYLQTISQENITNIAPLTAFGFKQKFHVKPEDFKLEDYI